MNHDVRSIARIAKSSTYFIEQSVLVLS